MEWALLDKPGVDNLVEYSTAQLRLPKYRRYGDLYDDLSKFRPAGDGHHADEPVVNYREHPAGDPSSFLPISFSSSCGSDWSVRKSAGMAN